MVIISFLDFKFVRVFYFDHKDKDAISLWVNTQCTRSVAHVFFLQPSISSTTQCVANLGISSFDVGIEPEGAADISGQAFIKEGRDILSGVFLNENH